MAVDSAAPTGNVRGAVNPQVTPWVSFSQQAREHVPELVYPRSISTYDRIMGTDAQAWGLYSGTVGPIEDFVWWVDPNGNDLGRVAALAEDLGLPVGEPDPDDDSLIEHTSLPGEFDFGELLHEALLAPALSHYYFEWAGEIREGLWRLTQMAPLHPSTLRHIESDRQGQLVYVSQQGRAPTPATPGVSGMPSRIGAERLVPFVFWPDATRKWVGRSLLRPLYRNWLCKDVLIRVDVTNHERAGGVPWIETDERYAGTSLDDLQRLASEFQVSEDGGAALPPGAILRLARAGGTDIIASIRYHDEQMSKVWQTMVRELGSTATGSRALGDTMVDLEATARLAIAGWAVKTLNRWVLARWWFWNFGERNGPVLRFKPRTPEGQAVATVPPAAAPPPEVGGAGDDPPVAAASRSPRGRDGVAQRDAGGVRPAAAGSARGRAPDGVRAAADPALTRVGLRSRVPDGVRDPTETEAAAAVDFEAIDVAYESAADDLERLFHDRVLPEHLEAVRDGIETTQAGTSRRRITADAMAKLTVPVTGVDEIREVLLRAASEGAMQAHAELEAQGLAVTLPTEADLAAAADDHAKAIARLWANGTQISVSQRAVRMSRSGLDAVGLADDVVEYSNGLSHDWEARQAHGAVQMALTSGRVSVWDQVPGQQAVRWYSSAALDGNACAQCAADDGREFDTLAEAQRVYPAGHAQCAGGPRCRCILTAVLGGETPPL